MSILLESDFLTVNLKTKFSSKTVNSTEHADSANNNSSIPDNTAATDEDQTVERQTNFDWGEELKKRIADNKTLSKDARRTDYEIETEFFKEYYKSNWDAASAKQLMLIGDNLRKAIKILGFNKKTNPILGFISNQYVINNLIKTKLLNVNTFKAIYDAVANNSIVDSEFFKENDYNVIYCKDFYKKPLKDMLKYLLIQKQILRPEEPVYKAAQKSINKKVLLNIEAVSEQDLTKRMAIIKKLNSDKLPSMTDENVTLNSIDTANTYVEAFKHNIEAGGGAVHLNNAGMQKLIDKLDTPSKVAAALIALATTTGNETARKAVTNEKFGGLSASQITKAAAQISEFMPKGRLSDKDTVKLVNSLLSKLG